MTTRVQQHSDVEKSCSSNGNGSSTATLENVARRQSRAEGISAGVFDRSCLTAVLWTLKCTYRLVTMVFLKAARKSKQQPTA